MSNSSSTIQHSSFSISSVVPVFGVNVMFAAIVDVPAVPVAVLVIEALVTPAVLVNDDRAVIVVVMVPCAGPQEHAADQ